MPTDPANDRFSVPVLYGEGPYDEHVNNNFDRLAVEVPKAGPIADRPNPGAAFAPERWYASDQHVEYYNTGGGWRKIDDRDGAIAPPGELQATLDAVAASGSDGYVRLQPGETYDEGAEISVWEGITLDCRGAAFVVSGNYNGLFVDNRAHIHGLDLNVTESGYSSSAIVLDTTRASWGDYTRNRGVEISGRLHHSDDRSPGSKGLDIQAIGGALGIQNYIQLSIFTFERGISVTADTYVNGLRFHGCHLHSNGHHVYHEGTGTAEAEFATDIYCVTQSGPNTTAVVTNETNTTSARLIGEMWDVGTMDTASGASAVDGNLVTIETRDFMARPFADVSPNAGPGSVVFGWGNDRQTMIELDTATTWEHVHDAGERRLTRDNTTVKTMTANGDVSLGTPGAGTIVRTPDGSAQYRIRVDNAGNVVTDPL